MNKATKDDSKKTFYLILLTDNEKRFTLNEGETKVGRDASNDIVIDDRFNLVSRQHAVISLKEGDCTYKDFPGSLNGSYYLTPEQDSNGHSQEKQIRIKRNAPYPVTVDTVIRMGGPNSITKEGKLACDIKILVETGEKKTTVAHPKSED